jgi:ubiquinone/menaquinone biosynthesis C-methylase UbiE
MKVRIPRRFIPEGIPWFAAGLYDRVARTAISSYYRKVGEEVIAEIACGTILDIGTGPGYLPIEIAKMAPNIKIDGIDSSRRMIKIACRNAAEAEMGHRVHFEVGDANRLRFEDDSYDMLISSGVFHSWRNPVRVLNECYRVLKQGKEAWIYDPAEIGSSDEGLSILQSLGWLDRIAHKWASLNPSTETYDIDEVREIAGKTKFESYRVEQKKGIKLKLRKG